MPTLFELSGAMVTLVAMDCQVETESAMINAEVNCLLIANANQEGVYKYLLDTFVGYEEADYKMPRPTRHVMVNKSRGRKERCEYSCIPAPECGSELPRWRCLRSIGMI